MGLVWPVFVEEKWQPVTDLDRALRLGLAE
jgi:hypothetical protein